MRLRNPFNRRSHVLGNFIALSFTSSLEMRKNMSIFASRIDGGSMNNVYRISGFTKGICVLGSSDRMGGC